MISRYTSLKQSFLYVECKSFPFVNCRLYSNGNGRFDIITIDGYGKIIEMKEDRNLDNAKKAFRNAIKKYVDVTV